MGWGPLGPRAATVRPAADTDSYAEAETWFRDCSAPGARDGTVPTSSWFNWLIGNLRFASAQAAIDVPNDQTIDEHLWNIIQNAITQRIGLTESFVPVPAQIRIFTSNGTWTKPEGLSHVRLQMWGGGGSGGSNDDTPFGGGGGNAGHVYGYVTADQLPASIAYIVGAGGASNPADEQTAGALGGDTTFNGLVAKGGGGGGAGGGAGVGGTFGEGGLFTIPTDFQARVIGIQGVRGYPGNPYNGIVTPSQVGLYGRGGSGGNTSVASVPGSNGLILIEEFAA
ncbi:MAG: hypothetical protein AB7F78_09930 [Hyphomicrobiaceae bacterium]